MKRFFRMLFMLLMVTFTAMSFSSCSSDDDEEDSPSNSIVGVWESKSYYGNETEISKITFESNGKITEEYSWTDGKDVESEISKGKYYITGETLTINIESVDGEKCNIVLTASYKMPSNKELILTIYYDDDEGPETLIYNRIK